MSLFNFWRRPKPAQSQETADDDLVFSRRAVDSCEDPMDGIFSMRISSDLRILGGRKARTMGLSLSEYMRFLLAKAVDSDEDTMPEEQDRRALRKGR